MWRRSAPWQMIAIKKINYQLNYYTLQPTLTHHEFHVLMQFKHFPSLRCFISEFLQGTVKHIDMSRTYIQSVDDETFQGLRLESLKLVDNRLREFGEKCFK